ncbi:MAG: capsular polysaccharide biosynthesis protein [Marinilabiliales bacterium]
MANRNQKKLLQDYSGLITDIHSHLLPGLDDGAQTIDESINYIIKLKKLGYKKLIITPHVILGGYNNTPEIIKETLYDLRNELIKRQIDIKLEAAAEYYLDNNFLSLIEKQEILYFGKEKYVLFESSYYDHSDLIYNAIFLLHTYGYKPVFAHPERYGYYQNDINHYIKIKEKGVYFQMNIVSLLSNYSPGSKKTAEMLIDNDMIDFLGTDLHNENYIHGITQMLNNKYIYKLIKSGKLLNNTL